MNLTFFGWFQSFLKGEMQIIADEAFHNAIQNYHDVFLKSDRVVRMVQSGACSQHDFREVFRNNIEKRVRSLPEIDGLSKETVLASWLAKFDCIFKGSGDDDSKRPTRMQQQTLNSEMILSKEQLYDMFQQILSVKKFEHQILFNALQLESADEQAAAIRRELDGRVQKVNEMEKVGFKNYPTNNIYAVSWRALKLWSYFSVYVTAFQIKNLYMDFFLYHHLMCAIFSFILRRLLYLYLHLFLLGYL